MFQFPNGIWHLARPQFDLIQKHRFSPFGKKWEQELRKDFCILLCAAFFLIYFVLKSGKIGFYPSYKEGKENLAVKNELVIFF